MAKVITGLSFISKKPYYIILSKYSKCHTFLQPNPINHLSLSAFSNIKMSIEVKLKELEVIPDVISTAPEEICEVQYPSGVSVDMGNELTPTQVKDVPKVSWKTDPNASYLLCMTDPDAPSRKEPTYREWHHWLLGNIKGNEIAKCDFLSHYIGAGPPPDTGLHRYVFLVYKQPQSIEFKEPILPNNSQDGRANFSIKKFAQKYNLGEPIAVNFFQAKYDDYVPTLYKQLGA